jgi:hypothetical protein
MLLTKCKSNPYNGYVYVHDQNVRGHVETAGEADYELRDVENDYDRNCSMEDWLPVDNGTRLERRNSSLQSRIGFSDALQKNLGKAKLGV